MDNILHSNYSILTWGVFGGILISSILFIVVILPGQQESQIQYEFERDWILNAECEELQQYIIEYLEGAEHHYFISKAKELHEWKCLK